MDTCLLLQAILQLHTSVYDNADLSLPNALTSSSSSYFLMFSLTYECHLTWSFTNPSVKLNYLIQFSSILLDMHFKQTCIKHYHLFSPSRMFPDLGEFWMVAL